MSSSTQHGSLRGRARPARGLRTRVTAIAVGIVAGLAAPAEAVPPANNFTGDAFVLTVNVADTRSNVEATVQTTEPLTVLGSGVCEQEQMGATLWYRVVGTGRRMAVSTSGSNFDTMLAVYGARGGLDDLLGCNNNAPAQQTSEVAFDSAQGQTYFIQAGGVDRNGASDPPPATGSLTIKASSQDASGPIVNPLQPPIMTDEPDANREPDDMPLTPGAVNAVVSITGRASRNGLPIVGGNDFEVLSLRVTAPLGALIRVECALRRCPIRQTIRTPPRATRRLARRLVSVRRLRGAVLRNGTRLRVYVTRTGLIGTYAAYTIRRGRFVKSQSCLAPGSLMRRPC